MSHAVVKSKSPRHRNARSTLNPHKTSPMKLTNPLLHSTDNRDEGRRSSSRVTGDKGERMSVRATVKATDDGPLIVKGPFAVLDGEGTEYVIERAVVALCRCGHSENKPFCDGSHARVGFRHEARAEPAGRARDDELERRPA